MITDEERRNVAANIRNAANRRKDDLQDDPDYSPFAALYAVFCGVRGFPRYKDLLHLADLIDRPKGRAFHTWMQWRAACSARDAARKSASTVCRTIVTNAGWRLPMVVSDEARREVAMFLRKCDCTTRDCAECERISEDLFGNKNALCDMNAPLEKVADLIDRGECENVYDESECGACDNGFECSVCGCRVEDEEHYHVSGVWNWCPQCGKRVWTIKHE